MPENDDLGFKSSLGPEQRHREGRQELQTIDHPESDYLISGLKPLRIQGRDSRSRARTADGDRDGSSSDARAG
jgi:hypothetical protein